MHRGPKLEGCAFANFGNSSGTEGKSRHEKLEKPKKKIEEVALAVVAFYISVSVLGFQ